MASQLDLEKTRERARTGSATPTAYDADFFRWTQEQAAFLKNGEWSKLDVANLVDEVESLGDAYKNEIESRMQILLIHLLKWQYQPDARSSGWKGTIVEQRKRVLRRVAKSPSLKSYPASVIVEEYEIARLKAAGETGLAEDIFPAGCPFTIEEILDGDYYPGDGTVRATT